MMPQVKIRCLNVTIWSHRSSREVSQDRPRLILPNFIFLGGLCICVWCEQMCTCFHACVFVCVGVHTWAHVYGGQRLISTLFTEAEFVVPWGIFCPWLLNAEIAGGVTTPIQHFHECWEFGRRSSHACSKHFIR